MKDKLKAAIRAIKSEKSRLTDNGKQALRIILGELLPEDASKTKRFKVSGGNLTCGLLTDDAIEASEMATLYGASIADRGVDA